MLSGRAQERGGGTSEGITASAFIAPHGVPTSPFALASTPLDAASATIAGTAHAAPGAAPRRRPPRPLRPRARRRRQLGARAARSCSPSTARRPPSASAARAQRRPGQRDPPRPRARLGPRRVALPRRGRRPPRPLALARPRGARRGQAAREARAAARSCACARPTWSGTRPRPGSCCRGRPTSGSGARHCRCRRLPGRSRPALHGVRSQSQVGPVESAIRKSGQCTRRPPRTVDEAAGLQELLQVDGSNAHYVASRRARSPSTRCLHPASGKPADTARPMTPHGSRIMPEQGTSALRRDRGVSRLSSTRRYVARLPAEVRGHESV